MSNSNKSSATSAPPAGIDKEFLYGEFLRGQRWRDRLYRKVAHKSLDIGDDEEMQIDKSSHGIGWKELAVIVLGLASTAGFVGWTMQGKNESPPASAPPQEPPAFSVDDSEYTVRFYDRHGNLIDVPPRAAP